MIGMKMIKRAVFNIKKSKINLFFTLFSFVVATTLLITFMVIREGIIVTERDKINMEDNYVFIESPEKNYQVFSSNYFGLLSEFFGSDSISPIAVEKISVEEDDFSYINNVIFTNQTYFENGYFYDNNILYQELLFGSYFTSDSSELVIEEGLYNILEDKTLNREVTIKGGIYTIVGVVSNSDETSRDISYCSNTSIEEELLCNQQIEFKIYTDFRNIQEMAQQRYKILNENANVYVFDQYIIKLSKPISDEQVIDIKNILEIPYDDFDTIIYRNQLVNKEIDDKLIDQEFVYLIFFIVVFYSGFTVISSIYHNLQERSNSIAIRHVVGATKRNIVSIVANELFLIGVLASIISIIIGTVLGNFISVYLYNNRFVLLSFGFTILIVSSISTLIYLFSVVGVYIMHNKKLYELLNRE